MSGLAASLLLLAEDMDVAKFSRNHFWVKLATLEHCRRDYASIRRVFRRLEIGLNILEQ